MSVRCSVVIANAGSGKTWTLANRVIRWSIEQLRARGSADPARVLAVTFTRKAAGEILARILSHAAQGAQEGPAGDNARKEFAAVVGDATRAEYLAVLKALVGELHHLRVGTIDGFFHRIATAMPEEVGLPADWQLGDDRELDELRARAAAEVLSGEGAERLVALLERGEPKASVTEAIGSLLGGNAIAPLDMYRATAAGGAAAIEHAWKWLDDLPMPGDLDDDGYSALIARVAALVPPSTGKGAPDKRWQSAIAALVDVLGSRDFRAIAKATFLLKMHRGESFYKLPMPDEYRALAAALAPHIRKALLGELRQQLDGALAVLPVASAALDRLQQEQRLFGFSDIGRGVAGAASRSDSRVASPDAVREALGGDIADLAIDEAQDTSVEQFVAMRPLIDEVLHGGRGGRFLLVGDPKQSIYGWRGGTPGLISHIQEHHKEQLGQGESLTRSYRSSPIVMDFVNRVFGDLKDQLLPLVPAAHLEELISAAAWTKKRGLPADSTVSAFKRAVEAWPFAHHESAKESLGGRITAAAYGKIAEQDGRPAAELSACACAAAVAARLHREAPSRSIGILVGTNKQITQTIAELKALGVPASDEGRATLLDSPAVQRIAAVLRLIDDPADRISHFLLSRGAMQQVTGLAELESFGATAENRAAARAAAEEYARAQRARIADIGLAEYLRGLFERLTQQGLSSRDASRLARVVAIAEDFAERPQARLIDFIDAIGADKADASSSDRIRVMTVHKSKGLEFDEVVALSLDEGWGAASRDWGMLVTDPTQPPQLVAPLANDAVRSWIPELAVLERDERRRGLLDDLSALYVQLTRARRGLHLVMKIPSKSSKGDTLPTAARLIVRAVDASAGQKDALEGAAPLGRALAEAKPDGGAPFWTHEFGAMPAEACVPVSNSVHAPAANAPAPALAPPVAVVPRPRQGTARPPSQHAHGLWQFDPFKNDDVALRGVLVHECFREVESLDAIATHELRGRLVARAAIRASVEKGEPVQDTLIEKTIALLERVATGQTGRALRSGGSIRVRTELPFVRETPDGLVHGRIDRLELEVRDGKVVGAAIIDFKTGATDSKPADLEQKKQGYFTQLAGYADAVEEMFGIEKSAIRRVLLFVDRDEVVEA